MNAERAARPEDLEDLASGDITPETVQAFEQLPQTVPPALADLAREINHHHVEATRAAGDAVRHACTAGERLIEAKAMLPHGQWLPWLEANCQVSERSAQAYMRVARELPKLEDSKAQRVADLPLREAVRLLASEPEDRVWIDADDPVAVLEASKAIRAQKAIENERAKQELQTRILAMPPLRGLYRTIVVDPGWPMQKIERDLRPDQVGFDYPTMTLAEIEELDIPAAEDCHLYLWTTEKFLFDAGEILKAWGFRYHFAMVWKKPGGPKPYNWPMLNCEFVLFGRKGTFDFLDTKAFCTCFEAPRREHSRKPDEFYDTVRRVSPGPRLDMFSRETREGFEQYGIEHDKFDGGA